MRSTLLLVATVASCGYAQTLMEPAGVPAAAAAFDATQPDTLRCSVTVTPPVLDYGFRFQAGYTLHAPAAQFERGAEWSVLTRITPQDPGRDPVYLTKSTSPAHVVRTGSEFDFSGGYVLGPGVYTAESILSDNRGRTCRQQWRINAELHHGGHGLQLSLPPFAIDARPRLHAADWNPPSNGGPLVLLVNAAPISLTRTQPDQEDRDTLLCSLAAIVGRTPASAVRLVIFNLDEQKNLYQSDHFSIDDLGRVSDAIDALKLATVDVRILQDPNGYGTYLARLIRDQLSGAEAPASVILLGPLSQVEGKFADAALNPPASTRFFYFQYERFPRRGLTPDNGGPSDPDDASLPRPAYIPGARSDADQALDAMNVRPGFPPQMNPPTHDLINTAVSTLKGRTLVIHSPGDLAKAIAAIESIR